MIFLGVWLLLFDATDYRCEPWEENIHVDVVLESHGGMIKRGAVVWTPFL